MADADDDPKGYRWETEYEKTWEAIREDEDGLLQASVQDIVHRARRKRLLDKKNIQLGMMRHLYVILDLSKAMVIQDLKPTRQLCMLKLLEGFTEEFFDQNPISQIGFITTKNKRAEKLSELTGNPKKHILSLQEATKIGCDGEPSLQNSLELACQTLRHVPGHTSREVLIILGSLTTCDPGDIYTVVESLKSSSIRCSVIGLAAELKVCRSLTKATKGTYDVILDESHFKELVYQHVAPPPALGTTDSSLIRMGFPHHQSEKDGKPSMCNCHLGSEQSGEGFGATGYYCPQCGGKYCELPVECNVCGLVLVSAPQLARSYHHLFTVESYQECESTEDRANCCFSCLTDVKGQMAYKCTLCQQLFCLDCDLFIHDALHCCPGCTSQHEIQ